MNVRMKLPNLLLVGLLPWIAQSIRSLNPNSPSLNASQLEYRFLPAIVGADRGILEALAPISRKANVVVASLGYGLVTRPQHERWVYIFAVIVETKWRERGIATEMIKQLLAYIKEAWPQVAGAYLGVLPLNGRAKSVYKRIGFVHEGEVYIPEIPSLMLGYIYHFNSSSAANLPKNLIQQPATFREGVGGLFGVGTFEALAPISRKAEILAASLGYGLATRPQHERWVYIFAVRVELDWRERGIATEMIKRLLAYIKGAWPQVAGAYLGVLEDNKPAKRLYERIGSFIEGKTIVFQIKKGWPQVAGAYLAVWPPNDPAKWAYEKIGFIYVNSVDMINNGQPLRVDGYVFDFKSPAADKLPQDVIPQEMELPITAYPVDDKLFYTIIAPERT
ncbi:hypothetical protein FOL46_003894 [Perkinsus olseni]|uniref:N-acetyltransferase domain-containing protein n=1 Tax=Perkinsus olseni TaxID=32597 RepID=A0A7J6M0L3_PEROL|nr:hypothetical protein FOL46_003894 [Perkinsus olseni]